MSHSSHTKSVEPWVTSVSRALKEVSRLDKAFDMISQSPRLITQQVSTWARALDQHSTAIASAQTRAYLMKAEYHFTIFTASLGICFIVPLKKTCCGHSAARFHEEWFTQSRISQFLGTRE